MALDIYQPITKFNHDPIAPVHFEELSIIWENDRRIPSRASRIAWSLARNLIPINVNSWWYRRKVIAEKFGISIPGGSYEQQPTPMHAAESVRSDAAFPPNPISDDTLVDSSSSTCSDVVFSNKMSSGSAHSPIKGAYIHESKVSEDVVGASDCTLVNISVPDSRDPSPLPPSSPNIWPSFASSYLARGFA